MLAVAAFACTGLGVQCVATLQGQAQSHMLGDVMATLWTLLRFFTIWAVFPLAYIPYALLRGLAEGKYAYPFLNVAKLGWGSVAVNAALIALGFIVTGYALVWLGRG